MTVMYTHVTLESGLFELMFSVSVDLTGLIAPEASLATSSGLHLYHESFSHTSSPNISERSFGVVTC